MKERLSSEVVGDTCLNQRLQIKILEIFKTSFLNLGFISPSSLNSYFGHLHVLCLNKLFVFRLSPRRVRKIKNADVGLLIGDCS